MGRALSFGLVSGLLLVSAEARAAVPDQFGFGSRSAALAGAVTADARDFSAGYYNPAGLVEAPGIELSFGYLYNVPRLSVNGIDNEVESMHGVVLGIVAPGEVFGIPFAFGIGTHLPDDGLSYIQARRQGVPRWELYDTRSQLLYFEACLAIRPFSWLELGGGIGYITATRGDFGIRGRADIISPFDSQLEHEVDADLTAVRYPQAGLRLILEDWGAFAATYRGRSNLDINLSARLEGIVEFAGIEVPLLYLLEAKTIAAFTPQQVQAGISFQRIPDFHINADVTWVNWSAYASPTAQIFARLTAEPPPGTPVELPDEPLPTEQIDPDFEDRFVPRVGIEYTGARFGPERPVRGENRHLVELPLRVGYSYEASPVPEQSGVANLMDSDRHTLTLGLGISLQRPFPQLLGEIALDVHGLFSFFPERSFLKDSAADFVGDYRASGQIFGAGGNLTVGF